MVVDVVVVVSRCGKGLTVVEVIGADGNLLRAGAIVELIAALISLSIPSNISFSIFSKSSSRLLQ